MTMAKVEDGSVVQVGLPPELRRYSEKQLKSFGWRLIQGTEKPTQETKPGYQWQYGATWSEADGVVYGTWNEEKRSQPFPSWSWVDGTGWVAPKPYPDDGNDYYWDEDSQSWIAEEF